MQIDIQTQGFTLTDALQDYVERRLQSVIGSRDQRVLRTQVRLSDINGPRGGIDKRCQLIIEIAGDRDVVVRDTSGNMYAAIDNAAGRIKRSLGRRLTRLRRSKRLARLREKLSFSKYSIAV
jgi:ribosomal subunit interface protein